MPATVHGEISADGSTIVLIATGPIHDVADAARALKLLTPLIKKTDPPGALQMPTSWASVIQLAETYGPNWQPGSHLQAWITDQLIRRAQPPTTTQRELLATPPAGLIPRSYQIEAACLIRSIGSVLLFDEPGTGKTITAILGLVERNAAGFPVLPIVVVAPSSVVDSWVAEFQRWAPQWRTIAYRGNPEQRRKLIGTADVYVVSYGTARRDAATTNPRTDPLIALSARTVVADETHMLKGLHTQQSRAVRRLAAKAGVFLGLSGTPITHHPGDLWPALVCLAPGAWPSRERWIRRYCDVIPNDYGEPTVLGLNRHTEPEFRTALLGQHRRVAKADVLAELPPKIYSVRSVELPAAWRKAYDAMESDMLAELPDGSELSVMSVLAQLTRLAQLASAPADVSQTVSTVEENGLSVERVHTSVRLRAPSWKVDALLEVLDERPGEHAVAFAPSRQLMRLAGDAATDAGYRVGYIVGGQTPKERTAAVEAFQAGELDLICATTGAGGVGLTLTAARTCVFLQRPWSLVEALQAEDRLHRIGAERHESIEVIDIIARNTIDTRVRAILRERAGQLADLVQDERIVMELLGGTKVRKLRKAS